MLTRRSVLPAIVLVLATSATLIPARGSADSETIVGWTSLPTDDLSDSQRAEIEAMLDRNRELLAAQGRLPAPAAPGVILSWPLRFTLGPSDFGYHGISAHVDHNSASPGVLDYNCGSRTYETHGGTDIMLWPLSWNRVDSGAVEVVAAADGILFGKVDGNPDHNCAPSGTWNAAFVRHPDGSISWYGHLKNGSVTTRNLGDPIATGEHLGAVASSGQSTGPHLHFEVHDSLNNKIDPYTGTCNSLNPESWWSTQRPYDDSAVNKLMTGSAAFVRGACPQPDVTNEATVFQPGNTIWFTTFYRDQLSSQISVDTIYRPDASVFTTWSLSSSQYYAASYASRSFPFGAGEPLGRWRFEVVFNGTTYNHDFWLGTPPPTPWLLRNAELSSISPLSAALSTIFVGTGATTLDLTGADSVAQAGEGDDDDAYVATFAAGQLDPDSTVVGDANRPLVFYQVEGAATTLQLVRSGSGITVFY